MSTRSYKLAPSEQRQGEMVATLATKAAVQAHGGNVRDPLSVFAAALSAVETVIGRGELVGDEARRARVTVLARFWQGYGVPGAGPDRYVERAWWAERFRFLGWVHLWADRPPPSLLFGGGVLYRGSTRARRDGLSWTPDRDTAAWFATQCDGRVWQVQACVASRFLVAMPMEVRSSGLPPTVEYLVDVSGLKVSPA